MGETTAIIAAQHPQNDYLGIEVHTPGVGSLLKEIATRELTNLRVIQHDAVEVVRDMIPPDRFPASTFSSPIRGRRSASRSAA
jgi:tRNA (guanine-N7-)-methyltransferase